MKRNFDLDAFETLPITLKPSDYIDFLLFCMHEKPCVRLGQNDCMVYHEMTLWCQKQKLAYIVSESGLMYVSKSKFFAWLAKCTDDSLLNHTYFFGKLLGYPSCCSKKIADVGETGIDSYEKELVLQNQFIPPFDLINPEGYLKGYALISHIPCCCNCKKSLKLAKKTYQIVQNYKEHPAFARWCDYWIKEG
jgi:hypothetical protein